MRLHHLDVALSAIISIGCLGTAADATVTVYDGDYAGFAADAPFAISGFSPTITCPGNQTTCFVGENPGTPSPGFFSFSTNNNSNINFTTSNWYAPTYYAHNFITESYEPERTADDYVQIDFNLPDVYAFGLDIGTYSGGAADYSLSSGDDYSDLASANFGSTKFIGFISDAALTGIRIDMPTGDDFIITRLYVAYTGDQFDIDGQAPAVPEPAGWTLMLIGLGGVGTAMRKRSRILTA